MPGTQDLPFADRMTIMIGIKLVENQLRVAEIVQLWRIGKLQLSSDIQLCNEVTGSPATRWFSYTHYQEGWTIFGCEPGKVLTPNMINERYMLNTSELIRVGEGWVLDPENTFIQ